MVCYVTIKIHTLRFENNGFVSFVISPAGFHGGHALHRDRAALCHGDVHTRGNARAIVHAPQDLAAHDRGTTGKDGRPDHREVSS